MSQIVHGDDGEVRFAIGVPADVAAVFDNPTVGDFFAHVTGVSTGNDEK